MILAHIQLSQFLTCLEGLQAGHRVTAVASETRDGQLLITGRPNAPEVEHLQISQLLQHAHLHTFIYMFIMLWA